MMMILILSSIASCPHDNHVHASFASPMGPNATLEIYTTQRHGDDYVSASPAVLMIIMSTHDDDDDDRADDDDDDDKDMKKIRIVIIAVAHHGQHHR